MTIVGISGCTALIVAGFGLKDAVLSVVPLQYNEIFKYDAEILSKDKVSNNELDNLKENIDKNEIINNSLKSYKKSIKVNSKDATIIVLKDNNFDEFISLRNRLFKNKISLNNDGIVITEKLSKLLKLKVNDKIEIELNDKKVEVKITDITENYSSHYIYMNEEQYNKLFDENVIYNNIYVNLKDDNKEQFTTEILKNDIVSNIDYINTISNIYTKSMNSLNYVVLVLIVSAGLLAFVVLYNLANVNISERKRELATIKVLGFYDKEVSSYVDRETIILTVIGIILGLIFGYILSTFLVTTCETDNIMLGRTIKILSYIYSVLITLTFSITVSLITHFSLKKIDMIESLKSVE